MLDKLKNSTSLRSMIQSSILLSSAPKKPSQDSSSEYGDHADTTVKLQGVAVAKHSMYMFTFVGDTQTDFFTLTVRNQSRQRYEFRDKPVLTALFKDHDKNEASDIAKKKIIALLKEDRICEENFS